MTNPLENNIEVTKLLQKLDEIRAHFDVVEAYIKYTGPHEKSKEALEAFLKIKDYILPK